MKKYLLKDIIDKFLLSNLNLHFLNYNNVLIIIKNL